MGYYLLKRILFLIPTLFVVSIVVFSIIHITPGDPASIMLGMQATEESLEALRIALGLDQPLHIQYVNWIVNVLQGDFGTSYYRNIPVMESIINRLEPSLSLAFLSIVLAVIIALPLGIIAAVRKNSIAEQSILIFSLFGLSIPSFLSGLFLMLLFAVILGLLPSSGYQPLSAGLWNHLQYMILPAIAIAIINAALIVRMTRSSMLEVLNTDYIKCARSKGVKESNVIYKHALKNALIPILTVIGNIFGNVISHAVIVEQVFGIPGFGQLIINSVARRDYPVVQGGILFAALAFVLVNLLVDLTYGVIDPRVRLGKKED